MKRGLIIAIIVAVLLGGAYFLSQSRRSPQSQTPQTLTNVKVTPAKNCDGELTPAATEGPYYKPGSPKRSVLREKGASGRPLVVAGYVYDTECKPVEGAWLDFWQADGQGNYDNAGYKLRGHQFTDSSGRYRLETVTPAEYSGRTPHIHVKVRAREDGSILTSQLYFPGKSANARDSIFNEQTLLKIQNKDGVTVGTYNFVIYR